MRIYLDHNATAPLSPAARLAMTELLEGPVAPLGNPSSIHGPGRAARAMLERARRQVAALLGADLDEIVFSSSGTEADALGLLGLHRLATAKRVILPRIEHPAVTAAAQALAAEGSALVWVAVDAAGRVEPAAWAEAVQGGGVATVALANHELGTVQDIAGLAETARAAGALFHCDAVQAAGKRSLQVHTLGVDTAAVSAHKLGGPMGVGALYVRRGLALVSAVAGGGQERGRRPGTENLLGIVGFGAAAMEAAGSLESRHEAMRRASSALETGLRCVAGVTVYGAGAERIGNTVLAGFDGALGETIVCALDLEGIAVSTGAACSSGTVKASQVLLALGHGERAAEAVRFSVGPDTSLVEIERVLEVLPPIIARARSFR